MGIYREGDPPAAAAAGGFMLAKPPCNTALWPIRSDILLRFTLRSSMSCTRCWWPLFTKLCTFLKYWHCGGAQGG